MKIVFFGTSDFAAGVLLSLLNAGLDIQAVVTRPDKPQGRSLKVMSPPVKLMLSSQESAIPVFQPLKASSEEFKEILKSFDADLFIVVAYGEILKQLILDLPKKACINVHASLLPKYRGAAPIHRCILDGCAESGITIMEMVLKMDAGDVIAVEKVPLSSDMNFLALEKKLLSTACDLLLKVIKKFDDYYARKVKQDESLVTYAEKITSEDLKINWNDSAEKCFNKVRAFSPSPGAWSYVLIGGDVKRIKIKKCDFISSDEVDPPGTAVIDNKSLSIVCRAGRIHVHDLQIEGKNSTSAQDFVNGLRTPVFFK